MLEGVSSFLVSIGINPTHLSAGLAGSLVRSFITSTKSKWEIFTGSLVGSLSAVYLTPIVVAWFNMDATQLSSTNGIAFGIGMTGMSLAEGAVRMAQRWAANPKLPTEISARGFAEATNPEPRHKQRRKRKPPEDTPSV